MRVLIRVDDKRLPALLACLGIGTLRAIQLGILPDEAGIWSLGATMAWAPEAIKELVPPVVVEAYLGSDELGAIRQVVSEEAYQEALQELITELEMSLAQLDDKVWRVGLDAGDDNVETDSLRKQRYENREKRT